MTDNFNYVLSISKVTKAMFQKYSVLSPAKRGTQLSKVTFEDLKKENLTMDLAEINAFLSDFKVLSQIPHLKRDDIKRIVRLINLKEPNPQIGQKTEVDYAGFIEFITQLAFQYGEQEILRPTVFMPRFWNYMKDVSMSS